MAGTIGTVLLSVAAPAIAEIAFVFGPAEYFSLAVLAFTCAALVWRGQPAAAGPPDPDPAFVEGGAFRMDTAHLHPQRRHAVRTGVVVEPDTTEGSREPGQHFPEVVVLLRERYDHGVVDTCLLHRNEETLGEFLAVGLGHRGVGRSRVFRPMRPEQVQMGIDDLRHAGGLLDVGLR